MEFDFYLELGSRAENSRILDLLRFPGPAALQGGGQWAARWWAHGKTKRMHSGDREKIFSKIEVERFNELELKWRAFEPAPVEAVKLVRAQLDFFPSPMNKLWAPVPLHKLKSHSEDLSRANFRNIESVLTKEYKLPYPSTLEYYLRLATAAEQLTDIDLQEASIRWIRSVIPKDLAVPGSFRVRLHPYKLQADVHGEKPWVAGNRSVRREVREHLSDLGWSACVMRGAGGGVEGIGYGSASFG